MSAPIRYIFLVGLLVLSGISVIFSAPAGATGATKRTAANCLETELGIWCNQTVATDPDGKFDGFGLGDADNDGKDEIIGVGLSGKIWLIEKKDGQWTQKAIYTAPVAQTETLLAAVGDVDPAKTGNEVMIVGRVSGEEEGGEGGAVRMLWNDGTGWKNELAWTTDTMVHGVAVGEFYGPHSGNEVAVMDFNDTMTMLYKDDQGAWQDETIFQNHPFAEGKTVAIGDVDPSHSGNEVVGTHEDGNISISYYSGTTWSNTVIYSNPKGDPENRCNIGDIDEDGANEITAGGSGRDVIILKRDGATWKATNVFTEADKTRGTWIGNFYDGNGDKPELVSGGYSGNVTIHVPDGANWKHAQIYNDGGVQLHYVRPGDVDPDHPGMEVYAGGYTKTIVELAQYHSTYELTAQTGSAEVKTETTATFNFNLTAKDYFSGKVTLTVAGLPTGATATFNAPDYLVSFITVAKMEVSVPFSVASGTYTLTVTATDTITPRTATVSLKVNRNLAYTVTAPVRDMQVKASDIGMYNITVKNTGDVANSYNITLTSTTQNWSDHIVLGESSLSLAPGAEEMFTVEVTVPEDTGQVTEISTITLTPQIGNETKTVTLTTTVPEKEKEKKPGPFMETAFLAGTLALAAAIVAVGRKKWI